MRLSPIRRKTLRATLRIAKRKDLVQGGYGVMLAQKLVDELIYDQKGNDVMLIKYLDVTPKENL